MIWKSYYWASRNEYKGIKINSNWLQGGNITLDSQCFSDYQKHFHKQRFYDL